MSARQLLKELLGRRPVQPQESSAASDRGLLQVEAVARYDASKWTAKRLRRALWCGERPDPIPSYTGLVEPPEDGKIGIACSGGGIRSAAFNLGALQVLEDEQVLRRARYLAGVSGGSYIAAAYCMVRKTWRGDKRPEKPRRKAEESDPRYKGWDDSDPGLIADYPPFFSGSPEEQYLRNRSSYLAPGAFGKIKFGYRLLLGMTLNLLFIAVAIVAVATLIAQLYGAIYPKLTVHIVHHGLCRKPFPARHGGKVYTDTVCHLLPLHVPMGLWIPIAAIATTALLMGAASILAYRWRPFVTEVTEVWSLRLFLFAVLAGAVLIGLPVLLSLYRAWGTVSPAPDATRHLRIGATLPVEQEAVGGASTATKIVAGAGGLVTLGSAVLLQLRAEWTEAKRLIGDAGAAKKWISKLSPALRRALAYTIAGLIGPALALALALEAMSLAIGFPRLESRWELTGGALLLFAISYYFADMTTWSLHSFYRRRLCSAFALKRRPRNEPESQESRTGLTARIARFLLALRSHPGDETKAPEPPISRVETGIAETRNYRRLVPMSDTAIDNGEDGRQQWPTLLVCAAANISDTAATPPGRAVTSFTFSPTAMGGPLVGSVETRALERACDKARRRYFSLPAAVAMSGAALSPSMGKMTRGPLRFLMALANVRLGVWVPNPRRLDTFKPDDPPERQAGESWLRLRLRGVIQKRRNKHYPTPRPSYLLRELLGMNPLNGKFLYVTDGGHYENLGLVELLRRGCTEIYCFDASNDNFDAIGDAVSLARSELDVEVELKWADLKANAKTGLAKADCVMGTIQYPNPDAPPATLYFARLALTGDAPADVLAYRNHDPHFPHDPTTDQLYTDQRFEAYRALGANAARTAIGLQAGTERKRQR
ncbi:MAG TPA: patatin-like phospholipase family protein [Solirubrobacteraceae bacterium]|nr:patatin-like phospholipase family protein [Solirubrobacteraceae bacterium]